MERDPPSRAKTVVSNVLVIRMILPPVFVLRGGCTTEDSRHKLLTNGLKYR
jgi:hypothetical protein